MKSKTYLEQLDYPTRAIRIYTNCTVENKKKRWKEDITLQLWRQIDRNLTIMTSIMRKPFDDVKLVQWENLQQKQLNNVQEGTMVDVKMHIVVCFVWAYLVCLTRGKSLGS